MPALIVTCVPGEEYEEDCLYNPTETHECGDWFALERAMENGAPLVPHRVNGESDRFSLLITAYNGGPVDGQSVRDPYWGFVLCCL